MKILILRFSSIGDIVLTTPVIRCLKKQLSGVEIHFLTRRSFQKVLENNPYIDTLHVFYENVSEVIPALKKENFDLIIDLHHNARTLKVKTALGKKSFSFDKLNLEKWMLVNLKINRLPNVHIVDRYMKTVESLGIKNDLAGLDYFVTEKDESVLQSIPSSHKPYIAWVIGAKHFTKQLPLDKMISIGKNISEPIVLLGGKEDVLKSVELKNALGEKAIDLCGKISLNESAAILKYAKKVITHDTGLMHIAAAFQKEITSVWGNTVPAFGMYPYMPGFESRNTMIEVSGLSCRPCSKIGFSKCPRGHFKCMMLIPDQLPL